jgi:hypothetical protein
VFVCVSLLGNNSIKIFTRRIGGDGVFYAVRVVSKGNRRLVLPRSTRNTILPLMSRQS